MSLATALLFLLYNLDGLDYFERLISFLQSQFLYTMKKVKLTIEFFDDDKTKKSSVTRVAPYVRVRNGKKELIRGYRRKSREL